jgi:hypothetical protein
LGKLKKTGNVTMASSTLDHQDAGGHTIDKKFEGFSSLE